MGIGPIPHSAIIAYARDDLSIDDEDELDYFIRMIRGMDGEYLKQSSPKGRGKKDADLVPITDTDGVRNMMHGIKVQRQAAEKQKRDRASAAANRKKLS